MGSGSISSNTVPLYSIFLRGTCFELSGKVRDAFSSVWFNNTDNYVFSTAAAPDCFRSHVIGFAHTGAYPRNSFMIPLVRSWGSILQPLLGRLSITDILSSYANNASTLVKKN